MQNSLLQLDSEPGVDSGQLSSQYLTFFMSGEEYGVDILSVQEIRGWESATPIPNAAPHIKGVINLRGTIVPIIDLRQCFGMPPIEYTSVTVVIVLKVIDQDKSRVIGIVVDSVSDVYSLSAGQLQPVPDMGKNMNTDIILGLVQFGQRMLILLNINLLLSENFIGTGLPEAADPAGP